MLEMLEELKMLKNWFATPAGAPVFTFILGLVALVVGALFNAHLSRRRDDRLRAEEAKAVSAALYGEILLMRQSARSAAMVVASTFQASEPQNVFNEHTLERASAPLKDARLYPALASKLGLLPPDVVLAITKFHADYEAVREWLPKLVEKRERGYSYGYLFVLRPAKNAVFDIKPALRDIELLLKIDKAEDPDMKRVLGVIEHLEVLQGG